MPNNVRLNISLDGERAVVTGYERIGSASGKTAAKIKADNETTGRSFDKISGATGRAGSSVLKMGTHFAKVGALGAAAFTGLAVVGGVEAAKTGMAWQNMASQLQVALRNTGQFSARTFKAMQDQAEALSTKGGFNAVENVQALTQLTRATSSHTKAVRDEVLATNVARGTGKNYLAIVKAIAMVEQGKTTGLSRLGIALPTGATSAQGIAALQKKFGGSTAAFSKTDAGSFSNLSNAFETLKKQVGIAFLPVLKDLSGVLTKLMPEISKTLGAIMPPFVKGLQLLLPPLLKIIQTTFPPLLHAISAILPPLARAITAIMPVVTTALRMLLPPLVNVIRQMMPPLTNMLRVGLPPLIRVFSAVVNALAPVLGRVIAILAPVIGRMIATLAPVMVRLINALAPPILRMINILAPVLAKVITTLAPALAKVVTALAPIIGQLATAFVTLAKPLTDALVALLPAITIFANAVSAVANLNPFGTSQRQLQAGGVHRTAHGGLTIGGRPVTEKHALGGLIGGSGNQDSVPAMLTPGEYVLRKRAVQSAGVANLNAINAGSHPSGAADGQLQPINLTVQLGTKIVAKSTFHEALKYQAKTGAFAA